MCRDRRSARVSRSSQGQQRRKSSCPAHLIGVKKICSRCGIEKDISEFYKRGDRDAVRSACKGCYNGDLNKTRRDRYESDSEYRDRVKEDAREQQRAIRVEVLTHYGSSCECCGEDRYEFLCLDHRDGGGNQHRKAVGKNASLLGSAFYWWVKREGFPDGFRVLCHNCNMSRGLYGYCPHKTKKK